MAEVPRISPAQARTEVMTGRALFVCAYESEDLCRRNRLEGSLSLAEFRQRVPTLTREQPIIFYCA